MLYYIVAIEVLFEPDTKIKVIGASLDEKYPGAIRIRVEVLETPPVLKDLVEKYEREKLLIH